MNFNKILENSITIARRHRYLIAISLLTVVALYVRFKGLTFQSYWNDELFSIATAFPNNSFIEVLARSVGGDVHPPLFHFLLWCWFKIFGFTELSGRALPALIGSLCIPAIYLLGKELFSKEVGLYAATIATFNFFLIAYSQEVRPYSLLLLLSILSLFFYLRTLKSAGKIDFIGFILVTAALVYTHYYGFIIITIEVLFLAIYLPVNKTRSTRLLIFAAISGVFLVLVLAPFIPSILADAGRTSFWIKRPDSGFFIEYFVRYFGSSLIVSLLMLALIVKGFVRGTDLRPEQPKSVGMTLLILWLIIAFLFPYIKSVTSLPVLIPRTSIIAVPAILYLASFGLSQIKQPTIKFILIGSLVVMSFVNIIWELDYYGEPKKEQYRDILIEVVHEYPDIPIYTQRDRANIRNFNIYARMLGMEPRMQGAKTLDLLLENSTAGNCFWLVSAHTDLSETKIQDYALEYSIEKRIEKIRAEAILLSANDVPGLSCANG